MTNFKSYDYNKKYSQKWDAENMKVVGTKVRISDYEKIKTYCDERGITISKLIKERLSDILDGSEN